MTDAPKFRIAEKDYPVPTSFRLGDTVLISEVTGLSYDEFTQLLQSSEQGDPVVLTGLIAVAVWQANPTWKRDRVVRYVEQIDIESIGADEPEDDPGPPAPAATAA